MDVGSEIALIRRHLALDMLEHDQSLKNWGEEEAKRCVVPLKYV